MLNDAVSFDSLYVSCKCGVDLCRDVICTDRVFVKVLYGTFCLSDDTMVLRCMAKQTPRTSDCTEWVV